MEQVQGAESLKASSKAELKYRKICLSAYWASSFLVNNFIEFGLLVTLALYIEHNKPAALREHYARSCSEYFLLVIDD